MKTDQEYVSSVTLMILGEDLDPDVVSKELSLMPSQFWRKGDPKSVVRRDGSTRVFDSRHEWGGWKRFVDRKHESDLLEIQLESWIQILRSKTESIASFQSNGWECVLSVFVVTDASASICLSGDLQKSLASLELEMEWTIWAGNGNEL